jgi:hypothetical protein
MADLSKSPSDASETVAWHENPSGFAQFTDVLSILPTPDPGLKNSRVKQKRGFISRVCNLTHDTYEVVVEYENDGDPFGFRAGQYAVLNRRVPSPRAIRYPSIPLPTCSHATSSSSRRKIF